MKEVIKNTEQLIAQTVRQMLAEYCYRQGVRNLQDSKIGLRLSSGLQLQGANIKEG